MQAQRRNALHAGIDWFDKTSLLEGDVVRDAHGSLPDNAVHHTNVFRESTARGFEPGQDPFQGIAVQRKISGSAILSDAMAFLECEVVGGFEAGDHYVLMGKIINGGILNDGHSMVHTRRNGFNY